MHRLRRSFAKSWHNDRWRDMLLAFLSWLTEASGEWVVPVSSEEVLALSLPPICWHAPISMPLDSELAETDDEDPSDDFAIYDDEGENFDPESDGASDDDA
jgi:hypothetical protein